MRGAVVKGLCSSPGIRDSADAILFLLSSRMIICILAR